MKNDLLYSLRLFIKNNGKNALDDNKILGNFIYTNTDIKYIPECEVLMICIKLGYHKKIISANVQERASVKKDIVEYLSKNESLDLNICNRTLDILEAALFEIKTPPENKKPEVNKIQLDKSKDVIIKYIEEEKRNQKGHKKYVGAIILIIGTIMTIIIYGIINNSDSSKTNRTPTVYPSLDQKPSKPETVNTIPSVARVTIHGGDLSIEKGKTYDFNAEVIGTNIPNQNVTWLLKETDRKSGTIINSSGHLTIDPNETLNRLTLTATSILDKSKSNSIIVTVIQPPSPSANPLIGTIWEFINQNDNGNRYRLSFSSNNNVTFAIYNREGSSSLESYNGKYTLQGNTLTIEIVYPEGKVTDRYIYSQSSIVNNQNRAIIYKPR